MSGHYCCSVTQSCPTLCGPTDCSPPGSSVLGTSHTRIRVCVLSLSRVRLLVTPWTVVYQAPLSMEFSRQECWSEWPFTSPGDLPDPGIEPATPALAGRFFTTEPPGKTLLGQGSSVLNATLLQSFSLTEETTTTPEHLQRAH